MRTLRIREITMMGLSIALTTIGTMVIQIPIPATNGYIHVGDGILLIVAVTLGARAGFIAGGIGSALADILTGYTIWAPFTLIIKGLMGYIMGRIASPSGEPSPLVTKRGLFGACLAAAWMVIGYYVSEAILTSSLQVPIFAIPWNFIQGIGGIIIYTLVGSLLSKANIMRGERDRKTN